MDTFEYLVDRMVPTSAIPPTFDHSLVVTVDSEVLASSARVQKVAHQTFEADGFSPADVLMTLQGLPPWNEPPCSPFISDDDPDANSRAHIRECTDIKELD